MEYKFKEYRPTEIISGHLKMGGISPEGIEINANSRYITRGGKPCIDVMGEYHFVRDNRENWYHELCKMKAGGVTIVATYIFWNYHEEDEGVFNFSGDCDLRCFVETAKRAGFDVWLRIGPWAHGECRNGGFPDWLMKKPFKLRSDDPGYLEKVKILYEKLYNEVKGLFYEEGGNIVGIQFENELQDNAEHIMTLKRLALEIGFKAPLYTVTGWDGGFGGAKIPLDEVLPVFGSYPEEPWAGHTRKLPLSHHYIFTTTRNDASIGKDIRDCVCEDGWRIPLERYPFATCELGGGNQVTHTRRPIIRPMDIYAMSLTKLGSGNNLIGYYMYHGGINKIGKYSTLNESKESGYPNDCPAISYDFQAPLSEYGEIRDSYRLTNLLHCFVRDFGELLAPMEAVLQETEGSCEDLTALRYAMRTNGESGFVFVNHYQRLAALEPIHDAVIDTGIVKFPPINVEGEIGFIMPFKLELSGETIEYATAQPICRDESGVYFFAEIPGIAAEYKFSDGETIKVSPRELIEKNGLKIMTISWEDALDLRLLSGRVHIGKGMDIFEADGNILSAEDGSFYYEVFDGSAFNEVFVEKSFTPARLILTECEKPFEIPYSYELSIGGERKLRFMKLEVTSDEGFVSIGETYDVAQIYADGQLVADSFYYGIDWRLPAKLLFGRECYLVMSEMKDDFFREF